MSNEQKGRCLKRLTEINEKLYNMLRRPLSSSTSPNVTTLDGLTHTIDASDGVEANLLTVGMTTVAPLSRVERAATQCTGGVRLNSTEDLYLLGRQAIANVLFGHHRGPRRGL